MLKTLIIGVMLLKIVSCSHPPTIRYPVEMYAVSLRFNEIAKGNKHLNYQLKEEMVGEWENKDQLFYLPLSYAPNEMMCFEQKTWLLIVKPKLKQASKYYND